MRLDKKFLAVEKPELHDEMHLVFPNSSGFLFILR